MMTMSKCMKESKHIKMMKNKVDPFVFLPDDILLDILKKLPDVVLRYKAKYVCRRWFNLITNNNISLLDDASFILQKSSGTGKSRIVGIREEEEEEEEQGGLEVKLEQNVNKIIPFGRIKSWYKEFVVITDVWREKTLCVYNLITNERLYLPQCNARCEPHFTDKCVVVLYFDRFKGVYKVVHFRKGPPFLCHILTLGREINNGDVTSSSSSSNCWKNMEADWLATENLRACWHDLVWVQVQGRYLHCDIHRSDYLVSVDMEKEKISKTRLPPESQLNHRCRLYSIFEMGGFLALINETNSSSTGKLLADIWILKDVQTMEWDKLQSITVPDYFIEEYPPDVTCFPYAVCGVIGKRYIIFVKGGGGSGKCCSYDMKNGVLKELNNIHIESGDRYVVHSSSAPSFRY